MLKIQVRQATEEVEIKEESSLSISPVQKSPIRKTHVGESSKILKPPTQVEMNVMYKAVNKLIDEMTEKTPSSSQVPLPP